MAQLLHFPVGISMLQHLAQDVGHIRSPDAQPCHGAGGLHGLDGQVVVLQFVSRPLTGLNLNPQRGHHTVHILGLHTGCQAVGNGLGQGIDTLFVARQGFGQLICMGITAANRFHGFAHHQFSGQPCPGSCHHHLPSANPVLFWKRFCTIRVSIFWAWASGMPSALISRACY